jgi:hypothetical protein
MIGNAQVNVGVAPTLLTTAETDTQAGSRLHVRNGSATAAVFLGGSGVTTDTGYELPAGAAVALTLDSGDALYAVTAVGTVEVHVLRIGV